ncbi:aldo-keto reductase family protein [Pyrobaculum aerophilum str. IM2]|uniref:Aldo-keto reductase family protein n=1 Tax=Pyrobaculum aerophilum (strain ATCC 51768 / DSM 7523 / JCM 9630 / CIP 104966 / NBRC 100827 / IM2) TaxID=178306 RepID=Q8ZXA1_PYRAE|nr:aldo/keto reductase [Pyrobaculum aerophilum]AAL63448.1 aldo-keto reductase family protein [Pyrobaculum aerophilum str. IM2]
MKIGSLEVGKIGLGAWQAGGGAWRVDFAELKRAYEYALDHGIKFIDTAEVYGSGKSEEFVAELIRNRPHVVVATKVAGSNWGRILKSAERSRRRIGRVDLLQFHWPPPIYVPLCKVIRDLEKAAQLGLTAEIGVSNFDARLMEKALTCTKKYEIVSDQVVYNPLHRAAERLIEMGRARGFVVIAWSPLAKGAVLKENLGNDPARRFDSVVNRAKTAEGRRVAETIRKIAETRGVSPAAVVLAWHAAKGSFPIPGVKTLKQAQEVLEANALQLSEAEVRAIDKASAPFITGTVWPSAMRYIPGFLLKLSFTLARI